MVALRREKLGLVGNAAGLGEEIVKFNKFVFKSLIKFCFALWLDEMVPRDHLGSQLLIFLLLIRFLLFRLYLLFKLLFRV
jgi:hypothetical protein